MKFSFKECCGSECTCTRPSASIKQKPKPDGSIVRLREYKSLERVTIKIPGTTLRFAITKVVKADASQIDVAADQTLVKSSPNLYGVFYEDINYAADGGLYAELVRNRSFEFSTADNKSYTSLTAWFFSFGDVISREIFGLKVGRLASARISPVRGFCTITVPASA